MSGVIGRDSQSSFGWKIDENGRLHVQATTDDSQHAATATGRGWNVNTSLVNLSDANETDLIYFAPTEDADFHVETIVVGAKTSDGTATDMLEIYIYKDIAVTSDIVTGAVVAPMVSNNKTGLSNALSGSFFVGNTADAIHTGGDKHAEVWMSDFGRTPIPLDLAVVKGHSITISIKPPASNTDLDVYVAIIGHITDPVSA